jgi:hypothetical protein
VDNTNYHPTLFTNFSVAKLRVGFHAMNPLVKETILSGDIPGSMA